MFCVEESQDNSGWGMIFDILKLGKLDYCRKFVRIFLDENW